MSDDQLEVLLLEKLEKVEQRKAQRESLKRMIAEQETDFLNIQARNDQLEKECATVKSAFERASKTLQNQLRHKEELFVKLQNVQTEIDSYLN